MSKLYIITGESNDAILECLRNLHADVYKGKISPKRRTYLFPETQEHPKHHMEWVYGLDLVGDTFIATHSPYILTAINNRILAHDTDAECPAFNRVGGGINFNDVVAVECWQDPKPGAAVLTRDIRNEEYRIIGASELDSASDILAADFDELLEWEMKHRNKS